jgi:hypothetical protein
MAKFQGPRPAGQGDFKSPAPGYQRTDSTPPGGKPVGSTPKNKEGIYTGIHVKPIGGSGKTISKPKPFKR